MIGELRARAAGADTTHGCARLGNFLGIQGSMAVAGGEYLIMAIYPRCLCFFEADSPWFGEGIMRLLRLVCGGLVRGLNWRGSGGGIRRCGFSFFVGALRCCSAGALQAEYIRGAHSAAPAATGLGCWRRTRGYVALHGWTMLRRLHRKWSAAAGRTEGHDRQR